MKVSDITIKLSDSRPEAPLSFRHKIELAKLLDRIGTSVIETGPMHSGVQDSILIKSLCTAVKNSAIAVPVDFSDPESPAKTWEALKGAAHPRLQVEVPVSTVQMEYLAHRKSSAMLDTLGALVKGCRQLCPDVEFIAEDFTRSEEEFLFNAVKAAIEAGATTVTLGDAAGNLLPEAFAAKVAAVKAAIPEGIALGVKCTNDLFMAEACAVAAIRAGATEVKASAADRSCTSLKRLVLILDAKAEELGITCPVATTELQRTADQIKRICETRKPSSLASLDGTSGSREEISLSKGDDRKAVRKATQALGYDLSAEDIDNVYEAFLRISMKDENVEAKELDAIVASVAFQAPPIYKLDSYVINSGNTISATCHLRLVKDGKTLESICIGDGPVDAAFLAIEKLVDRQYELDDFQIQAVTEGREAMGEAVVRLRCDGRLFSGRGISTDIVGASIMAHLGAVNKIVNEER